MNNELKVIVNIKLQGYNGKTATKRVKINMDNYKSIVGNFNPEWEKPFIWKKLSNMQKLRSYLDRMCQDEGGLSYTYDILD